MDDIDNISEENQDKILGTLTEMNQLLKEMKTDLQDIKQSENQ